MTQPVPVLATQAGPRPGRSRWQPLRSGLLNLYRFDHEEFHFEDGHLLLRGNNGTGKSRVLALQLPFLLDGDVSPYRLEPDGDPAKRIEWNLLMGKHSDRLGYTWIEFGRRVAAESAGVDPGDDGSFEDRFLTLGCGLQAVEGRGLASKWFFVTERRVGIDLSLQGGAGEALTRKRLEETLGDDGEIFTAAGDYRRAIDRHLFGLGESRYEALVRLLIQLRQPQLARKLDEQMLSKALSDALPPLSESILADVAEAFAGLESDRQAVDDLRAAGKGADDFLEVYRRYAQVLTRRRAGDVRTCHSAYEHSMRRLREAEATRDDAARRSAALGERRQRLKAEHERLDAEVRALEASPEMRDKQSLDAARRRAESARRELERATSRLASAREQLEAGQRRLGEARAAAASRQDEARRQLEAARAAARQASLDRRHGEAWTDLQDALDDAPPPDAAVLAERGLDALRTELEHRREGLRHLRELAAEIDRRQAALIHAKEDHARVTSEVDQGVEAHRRALAAVEAAVSALREAFASWRAGLEVLRLEAPADLDLEELLADWARELAGPSPLARAVESAAEKAREVVASHLAAIESQLAVHKAEQRELESVARELEAGVEVPPPAPHTRDPQLRPARTESAGAPLWRLCDFVDGVPDAIRAAAEAALEAAGLLDAWVTADGRLLDAAEHDTLLSVAADAASQGDLPSVSLDRILRPDPDAAGGDRLAETVQAILRRIGWVEDQGDAPEAGRVWVAANGRFRIGPLHGAWQKDAAQYLGASARHAERRRRLAEIARRIDVVEGLLGALRGERDEARHQAETIRREVASAPSADTVREAAAEVSAARREVTRARERQVAAQTRVHARRSARDETVAERDRAALDLGLAERVDDLDALGRAVDVYGERLASLGPVLDLHRTAADELRLRHGEAERRQTETEHLAAEHQEAESLERRTEAERRTLEENLGESVERLLHKLDAARGERQLRSSEMDAAREEETGLRVAEARAAERIESETATLAGHEAERQRAVGGLRDLATLRLLAIAAPGTETGDAGEWSVTRAVEVARVLEAGLDAVDAEDAVWDRLQGRVLDRFRALQDALLPHRYEPSLTTPSGTVVVKVPFQGQSIHVDEFRAALVEETEARDRVLAAREREILENHLLSEVSLHLHDRLRAAEELVREINAEIEDRPMSTGMKLRFDWRPLTDEVEHLSQARRLLLTDHRMRSAEENRSIGQFLQGLIEQQRESEGGGTWMDHLTRALDYRSWHRFAIEQQQDGQWRRLTRRTHGTGSGGEKAIALTVPQFAAAAAHYRTARDEAPRLILLDEAFVGVDADMRAKCMGLLAAFDLDFVMTSEREWGCYPTLPGLAIYQLATHPGIDAVGVTRWVWNGKERVRAAQPRPPRFTGSAASSEPEPRQAEIFAAGSSPSA